MSLEAAAHIGHQVNHTSALAGFVAGAIVGGAIAVIGIALTVGTAGLAAPAGLALIGLGVGVGSFVGEMVGKHFSPPTPSGPITTGSPNVFINGKNAAFCTSDVACVKDATQKIAQGSATVGYNQKPAARVGDKGTCGFAVGEGSPNVFVGGGMGGCGLAVGDEVPWYARAIVMVIGLAGGVAGLAKAGVCALGIVARLGAGMVVGGAGSYIGGIFGGKLFGEGSFGQDLMSFLGGEALSRLAFRGPMGRWMVGEPIDVVTGEVVMEQTDFKLPAALPLELNRYYASGLTYGSCFGPKWASTWGQFVTVDSTYAYFHSDDGRRIPFELPEGDEEVRHPFTNKFRLRRTETGFAVRDEANCTRRFENVANGRFLLSAIENLNGYRIDFIHEENGALREIRHSGGYRLAVEGTAEAITRVYLISEDGALEELVRYDYDALGRLSEVYNQSGLPMRFEYDTEARLKRWEDRRQTWFAYEYNSEGRCVRTRGAGGMYSGSLAYDESTLTNSYTDSLSNTTHYTYNGEFQVIKVTDPRGAVTLFDYDERDNVLSQTDPLGNTTEFFYDPDGNLIKQINALGATVSTSYNQLHLPENSVDPLGRVLRCEYDAKGNVVKVVEPNGNSYGYELDELGNVLEIVNSLGDKCLLEYDPKGLPVSVTDWKNHKTVLRRNPKGLVSERLDPHGHRTQYEYAYFDKLSKVTLATGANLFWEHDAEGNVFKYTDEAGRIYQYEYGYFDLLIGERLPDLSRRRYRYDTEARLVTVENELGDSYSYHYNSTGQVIREDDFTGRVLYYEYDLTGRCTKKINGASQIISFQYDSLGQVLKQINAEGGETTFEYDAGGSIVKAISGDGVETALERNERGQITSELQNDQRLESSFDPLGRRTARRTMRGGETKWRYDENSLPLEVQLAGGANLQFQYDATGRETRRQISGSIVLQKEYDALDRLTRQWTQLDSQGDIALLTSRISEQRYIYDESGNPIVAQDERTGKTEYEYDLLGRVTRVRRDRREFEDYAYDAAGNITSAAVSLTNLLDEAWQGRRELSAGGKLQQAGWVNYKYDDDGRVMEKTATAATGEIELWKFKWSSEGRLTSVVNPKGEHWQYRYDAFGRRVEKIGKTGTTRYVWDGAVIVEQINSNEEVSAWEYEDSSFRPLAKVENGQVFAVVNDQSGKPQELLNQTGEAAWRLQTSLWSVGIDEQPAAQTDCNLRFQGQWFDEESGLHYNFHRYYDPQTGRYISSDPIGLEGGLNTYGYVHNPLAWVDPFGLAGCNSRWTPKDVNGRRVYQRNDIFDPGRRSSWQNPDGTFRRGTNVERMQAGLAPVGTDGKSVQLHHLTQTEVNGMNGTRGSLAEVTSTFHSQNSKVLHYPNPKIPRYSSFRRNIDGSLSTQAAEFDAYRADYWRTRAGDF